MRTVTIAAISAAVLLTTLTSCKGRTADNMEPTGDTVEVFIMPEAEAADTAALPVADTAANVSAVNGPVNTPERHYNKDVNR